MYFSLFTLGHALEKKAIFAFSEMNLLNRINEAFVLLSSYFLISFTQIVDDADFRNKIGLFYIYLILVVITLNIITLVIYIVSKY